MNMNKNRKYEKMREEKKIIQNMNEIEVGFSVVYMFHAGKRISAIRSLMIQTKSALKSIPMKFWAMGCHGLCAFGVLRLLWTTFEYVPKKFFFLAEFGIWKTKKKEWKKEENEKDK